MTRKKIAVLILSLAGVTSAGIFALAQAFSAHPQAAPRITDVPTEAVPAAIETPVLVEPSSPGGCYYVWAYEELPEIGANFQAAVQALVPEAKARTSAFGEDCVHEDGSTTFSAMETDFYVIIPVSDLTNNETLGLLIEKILPIADEFAPPRVPGPQLGFVEFTFRKDSEQRVLRVPILLGMQLREQNLHGADLIAAIEGK